MLDEEIKKRYNEIVDNDKKLYEEVLDIKNMFLELHPAIIETDKEVLKKNGNDK